MRLCALISLLFIVPATAQYTVGLPNQHGHRVSHQFAYLVESQAPLVLPPNVSGVNPRLLPELESAGVQLGIQANTQLTNRGIFNIQGDRAVRIKLTSAVPSIDIETWVEDVFTDSAYQDHVPTGSSGFERAGDKITIQRFVRDEVRHIYASYSITVETLPEPDAYRIAFADSSAAIPATLLASPDWSFVSPPQYPVPQILHQGETVPLVLYSHPRKLVDYIRVGSLGAMEERKEAPHESYADDAEFTLTRPRVQLNGVEKPSAPAPEIQGPILWVYVPDHGRYVFSFRPEPDLGFDGVGEAYGNVLTFADGGNIIRIESTERIAAGSGVYRVHVLKDAAWTPADPNDRTKVMIGSAPGL